MWPRLRPDEERRRGLRMCAAIAVIYVVLEVLGVQQYASAFAGTTALDGSSLLGVLWILARVFTLTITPTALLAVLLWWVGSSCVKRFGPSSR